MLKLQNISRGKFKYGAWAGFTLVELLVVISIIGFLTVSSVVVFNIVRMNARDAVRVGNIATIKRALAMYLNDSTTGYPASTGECISAGSGVGAELKAAQSLLDVPLDPLWPTAAPANGDVENATNFCYYYKSETRDTYSIGYYLESSSKSGESGPHLTTQ